MAHHKMSWDDRLLFAPLHTLSARGRTLVVIVSTLLTFGWCALQEGDLRYAWSLPDVKFYILMAQGRYNLVPAPFSARPLAPLFAQALSRLTHGTTENGFALLAFCSLCLALAAVFWLATRSRAPRWTLLLVATVAFWPQLLGNAGLPDPLYTALLASLLVALESESLHLAAALMLPLMLTRESTWLTLLCLLAVGWRRLRWPGTLLAVGSTVAGALIVRHLSQGSLPNPEHLSGSLYLAGKLLANTARSFGIDPWSNVYPDICSTPQWQHPFHLGAISSVGVCEFAADSPLQAVSAVLTVFGMLPALAVALWAGTRRHAWRQVLSRTSLLTRFCLLYGGLSFLIAPSLGTWYGRLFGYGWPLFLVAVPRLLEPPPALPSAAGVPRKAFVCWGLLALLHLFILTQSRLPIPSGILALLGFLQAGWIALFLVQRRSSAAPAAPA